jgi:putative restriction endonuclease
MSQSIPAGLTYDHVVQAIADLDRGVEAPFGTPTGYELIFNGKRYAPKAVIGLACRSLIGRILRSDEFSGGEAPGQANNILRLLGFDVIGIGPKSIPEDQVKIQREREYRLELWRKLHEIGGPTGVAPQKLRELGVYGGAQGIWVDKERTSQITKSGDGITVSVLHTGSSYADDLSEDCIVYHYPRTRRPSSRDLSEINATKAASTYSIPFFVISYAAKNSNVRDVHLGWVESWDDQSRTFLITFGETAPESQTDELLDDSPFALIGTDQPIKREVNSRSGQQRFKFKVFKRYTAKCAVCGLSMQELLDAAHVCPKTARGIDDPRNGLVLCANHHRAFDAGLFAIEPSGMKICYSNSGPSQLDLGIAYSSLTHLRFQPHKDAVSWHWNEAMKRYPGRFSS